MRSTIAYLLLSAASVGGLLMVLHAGPSHGAAEPAGNPPEPRFPEVRGSNLDGQEFSFPGDFEGDHNLLFIAFERGQQAEVDTWLPLARTLEDDFPGVRAYELPTIKELPGFVRGFIDRGMSGGIKDPRARASTVTLYLDKKPFRASLGITTEATITVLVVDRTGTVLWQTVGWWTPEKERALREVVGGKP